MTIVQVNKITIMRKGIHPEYHEITVKLTNGKTFKTKSTYGNKGDVVALDIDPLSHPVWTGEGQKLVDTGGQISKFTKRFKSFNTK